MHIYVDDQPYAVSDMAGKTLRDVAGEIRDTLLPNKRILIAIYLNSSKQPVPPGQIEQTLDSAVSQFERIDFQSAEPRTLAREVLTQSRMLIAETTPICREAGELLAGGQTARAMEMLGNCFVVWSQVQDSMIKSVQLLGLDLTKVTVKDQPADIVIEEFADELRQIKEALENRDYVQLSDILQYELQEVSPRWQALLDQLVQQIDPS